MSSWFSFVIFIFTTLSKKLYLLVDYYLFFEVQGQSTTVIYCQHWLIDCSFYVMWLVYFEAKRLRAERPMFHSTISWRCNRTLPFELSLLFVLYCDYCQCLFLFSVVPYCWKSFKSLNSEFKINFQMSDSLKKSINAWSTLN